jgi:putative transposase
MAERNTPHASNGSNRSVPGVAHQVRQHGTGWQNVFYTRRDRQVYLGLLKEHSVKVGLAVRAYCLIPNHVHLIVVPNEKDTPALLLRQRDCRCYTH